MGTVQQALGFNSLQLMLKQMPLSAAALLPIIALTGDVTGAAPPLSSVTLTPQLLGMIALTAVMSFFENVSTTYIIAELSPIRFPPPPPTPHTLVVVRPSHAAAATTCLATARRASSSSVAQCCSARCSRPTTLSLSLPPPSLSPPRPTLAQAPCGMCCCVIVVRSHEAAGTAAIGCAAGRWRALRQRRPGGQDYVNKRNAAGAMPRQLTASARCSIGDLLKMTRSTAGGRRLLHVALLFQSCS